MEHKELKSIIAQTKTKFGILEYEIPPETVRTRYQQQRLNPKHQGTPSPVSKIEETLVEICLGMSAARQPLTCAEGLMLVNLMIKGWELEQTVISFKKDRGLINENSDPRILGPKYWTSFL